MENVKHYIKGKKEASRKLRTPFFVTVIVFACVISCLIVWNGLFLSWPSSSTSSSSLAIPVNYQTGSRVTSAEAVANLPSSSSEKQRFCDGEMRPCVFDIGHNTGQDTMRYLKDSVNGRKVLVVAVDANPVLINASLDKFKEEVAAGRLILITAGLVGPTEKGREPLEFWVNKKVDKFSSFQEHLGCRDGYGKYVPPAGDERRRELCEKIRVPTRTCASLVQEFGVPLYVKIDIEGLDSVCVESIAALPFSQRPKYISVENVSKYSINWLRSAGYAQFKAVNQLEHDLNLSLDSALRGYSGPWGEDALDYLSGTQWTSADEMLNRLPLPTNMTINGKNRRVWYDLHAKFL